ncbi:MAG: glycosyltransferase family 4 protein [Candidatus Binatia bacterium]
MRVLLITDWNSGRGGVEAYITWLQAGLRAAGDEVRLLTSSVGDGGNGSADVVAYGTDRLAAQVFLQIFNPFAVARVHTTLRTFHPDVVFVNMFVHHLSPAIFAVLRSLPTVLGVSDYKCVCPIGTKLLPDGSRCTMPAGWVCYRTGCVSLPHWLRDRPRYALLRAGVRQVDRVLACGHWLQRELDSDGIASEVITWPVPPVGPGFRHVPAAEPVFVFCGRLEVEKGAALLLRAFARVRRDVSRAHLRIIGRGTERAHLEQLAGTLGLDGAVTFMGWLNPEQVERQLVDAWALVAPSLWAEPLGLVAIEAIVRGVPVVASASGGFGETVEHGVSGLLFPNGDNEALADRMLAIVRGHAFPAHTIPLDVVSRVAEAHDLRRHVDRMRGILSEVGR